MNKRAHNKKIKVVFAAISWVFLAAVFIVFIVLAGRYKTESYRFALKNINIIFDNGEHLTGDKAFSYLGIQKNTPIFRIAPDGVAAAILKKHPEVLSAEVRKIMPNSMAVDVVNRIPIAQVRLGRFYAVDKNGFILPFAGNFKKDGLPLIEGLDVKEVVIGSDNNNDKIKAALNMIELMLPVINDNGNANISIDVANISDINLILTNGIKVKFGNKCSEDQILKLKDVLADVRSKKISPASIDLRFDKIILIPR